MGRSRLDREGRKTATAGLDAKDGGNFVRGAGTDPRGGSDRPRSRHFGGRRRRARRGHVPRSASAGPGGGAAGSDFPFSHLERGGDPPQGTGRAATACSRRAIPGTPRTGGVGSARAADPEGKCRPARRIGALHRCFGSDADAAMQEGLLETRRTSWSAAGCNRPALRTWSKPPKS
jgi:hypothetical protein